MKRFIIIISLTIILIQLAAIPTSAQDGDIKLVPDDGAAEDVFGTAVAIDDNTIVVGARYDDDNGSNSGSAYVFSDNGTSWPQVAKLVPDDGAAGDTCLEPPSLSTITPSWSGRTLTMIMDQIQGLPMCSVTTAPAGTKLPSSSPVTALPGICLDGLYLLVEISS
jgi:hypothetical protein